MAVPKKKTSKARSRSRRAASWRVRQAGRGMCSRCRAVKRPHHVCGTCGWYHGRQAMEIE